MTNYFIVSEVLRGNVFSGVCKRVIFYVLRKIVVVICSNELLFKEMLPGKHKTCISCRTRCQSSMREGDADSAAVYPFEGSIASTQAN